MIISVLEVDLAKSSFQLHGADKTGRCVLRKKLTRAKFEAFVQGLTQPTTIAMEACGSANYWGRIFRARGHTVKLISPQFVKPFVKSQKNDRNDAEAIVEAALRPHMRFVSIKEKWQQDLLMLHRVRSRLVADKTALSNQIRGFLNENGITFPQGFFHLHKQIQAILVDSSPTELTIACKQILQKLWSEFLLIDTARSPKRSSQSPQNPLPDARPIGAPQLYDAPNQILAVRRFTSNYPSTCSYNPAFDSPTNLA